MVKIILNFLFSRILTILTSVNCEYNQYIQNFFAELITLWYWVEQPTF